MVLGLSAQGCGGDDDASTPDGGTAGSGGTAGADSGDEDAAIDGPDVEVGQFSLQLNPPRAATPLTPARAGSTSVVGTVGDKVKPEAILWEMEREADGCRLLVPRAPFCDPSCGREICVADDTCTPDRTLLDVGTVSINGVRTTEGADNLTLISVRNTYQNGLVEMPYPAFDPGDAIRLTASGAGAIAPFAIDTIGTTVLAVPEVDYPLVEGSPLDLTWTAPSGTPSSRILVKLDISHHGGSKGKIECDVEDDGALTIPADMVTDLLALGVAGFPSVVITRFTEESAQLGHGRVVFQISEYAERWITVEGLVSCTATSQCPEGQTCRDDKTCG